MLNQESTVSHPHLVRNLVHEHLLQRVVPLGLWRDEPAVDGDAEVLQQALVLRQLGLERLERDAGRKGLKERERW